MFPTRPGISGIRKRRERKFERRPPTKRKEPEKRGELEEKKPPIHWRGGKQLLSKEAS